jgi:hypothetical protein
LEQPFNGEPMAIHLRDIVVVDFQILDIDPGWHALALSPAPA